MRRLLVSWLPGDGRIPSHTHCYGLPITEHQAL